MAGEINSVLDRLTEWLSEGKTLRDFSRQDGNPCKSLIYRMIESSDDDTRGRIARAREEGEDAIAQECLEIADDARNDWMETKQGKALDAEHVQRSKLRIETRLKLLAKWNPKKYGEKVDMNLGGQAGNPIQAAVTVEFVRPKE